MKTKKKAITPVPQVQISGDLEEIKQLIKVLNKKKTVVLFRDMESGIHYAEIDKKIDQFPTELIHNLKKDYRFVYFDFFPSRKMSEQPIVDKPLETIDSETELSVEEMLALESSSAKTKKPIKKKESTPKKKH